MRSQLTRSVFRGLLSTEGLVLRCHASIPTRRASRWRRGSYAGGGMRVAGGIQQRSLFGFSRKEERKPKDPELVPGLETFIEFSNMQRIGARLPLVPDLVRAWQQFFDYKNQKKEPLNKLQAVQVSRTFNYLKEVQTKEGVYDLSIVALKNARRALLLMPKDNEVDLHSELARGIYDELVRRGRWQLADVGYLVGVLTRTGDTTAALKLVQEHYAELTAVETDVPTSSSKAKFIWKLILAGFAKENNETELLKTLEIMGDGFPHNLDTQKIMTCFYAERDNVEATKMWFDKPGADGTPLRRISPRTLTAIMKFSIRNNELDWCKQCFRDVVERDPTKDQWDIVLQWAAGAVGKGVEDVEQMMEVMSKRNPDLQPDITTINGLVSLAMSQKDPYLAERYIALGLKSNILPNARTFILQMNYRVDAGDLRGAQSAYESLQGEEILDDEDLPAINHYIRALCASKTNYYDSITSILQDLEARKARLEADTVSAVAMLYMSHSQIDDIYDLLQTNSYHYTLPERASIRDTFYAYVFDRTVPTPKAWEAYQILRTLFDETDVAMRTKLMEEFFARGRSDMGTYVFGHMRSHTLPSHRPTLTTYVSVFLNIARLSDLDSLEMVHNMLKLDPNIEPNTLLYNALMLAYASTGDGDHALEFWDDITNSEEGPSYRSLEIVMRACEMTPFGDLRAREIWDRMRRMEIEITQGVWGAYVGALAGRGKLEDAKAVVEGGEVDFGLKPDALTLGIFYNAIPGRDRKEAVAEWAKAMYPEPWAELEKVGQREHVEGWSLFNIEREWKA
ncbi:Complex I intermediate-associated protein, mitochondrial [Lachnellula subtilissima]|uniref:Complex I intermediate-associated protein, mitochondrial n=1 Tax=Lachnellula subtilissima TaxID=602034 RepID=A0A8H8S195_9HELO|nr:Complex I intermediate-associated protein, mitochondrial [Lachnellula subtilissima]